MKKQWPYFILAFLLPTLAVLWWWGLFGSASISSVTSQPYRYAYLEATGAFSKLADKQHEVQLELDKQGVRPLGGITLILDDPRTTPYQQRKARTGYLIDEAARPGAPLSVEVIPARRVLRAAIKAHPLFAYGKVYGALLDHLAERQLSLNLPTVERWEGSVLLVEMPLENSP